MVFDWILAAGAGLFIFLIGLRCWGGLSFIRIADGFWGGIERTDTGLRRYDDIIKGWYLFMEALIKSLFVTPVETGVHFCRSMDTGKVYNLKGTSNLKVTSALRVPV